MTNFKYTDESFADIQLLRYRVEGFEDLPIKQKTLIYHLTEAALAGRDILYDQNGQYNLRLRAMFEAVYQALPAATVPETSVEGPTATAPEGPEADSDAAAFREYMKRFWFSHGLHHHYGCEKFIPGFSEKWLREQLNALRLPIDETLLRVVFDPAIAACRCNQRDGDDLLLTSASNYYQDGITQAEAEAFYAAQRQAAEAATATVPEASPEGTPAGPVQYGLNSRLCRDTDGSLYEDVASTEGHYAAAIRAIVGHLEKARLFVETTAQLEVIDRLIDFYRTGDLHTFDDYCIAWLRDTESLVDFVNGFTETYGDPLGLKASWESIVNFKDLVATRRTETLADNAQWFEDHSPVDARFKKEECRGISAKVITAAIIAGDLYPATAIGINLPNSDWVRRDHGSKSVTIGNFTDAYNRASRGSGMLEEFCIDEPTRQFIREYGDVCDDLHTDLHECLGHGSGQLLPGVASDALGVYGSTIEEARADLFALYYLADPKLTELGLTPNVEAYRSNYYTYLQNGLLTQLIRIQPGHVIEEAHMRNRALIARWVTAPFHLPPLGGEHEASEATVPEASAEGTVPAAELIRRDGKTFLRVNDYPALRSLFGRLLAEIQRIKSEGDFEAARRLVEDYGVQIDPELHREVLDRYARLGLRPYKGFINPVYIPLRNADDEITDVIVTYTEAFDQQNLRYSR
ncbi:MAG: dihydrofolate reductase, partial [Bacteroidales bacterium]|nr:dihydrofolate reductase [Bacteroidales bacterium]